MFECGNKRGVFVRKICRGEVEELVCEFVVCLRKCF